MVFDIINLTHERVAHFKGPELVAVSANLVESANLEVVNVILRELSAAPMVSAL